MSGVIRPMAESSMWIYARPGVFEESAMDPMKNGAVCMGSE